MGVVLARLLFGESPVDTLRAHLGGRLVALKKADGGVRPLSCGSILRRIVARAACKVEADVLRELGGPHQYGISRPAGVEVMHKILVASAEERPAAAFLSFDCKNAFNMITRPAIRRACRETTLGRIADAWYSDSSTHWFWDASGKAWQVDSARGVDQGCPLSPGLFCAALAPALKDIDQHIRSVDPQARVYAYLDDIFVVVDSRFVAETISGTKEALQGVGLELNLAKSKLWVPEPAAPVPAPAAVQMVRELRCLGNTMHFARATLDEDDQHRLGAPVACGSRFDASLESLDNFLRRIRDLHGKGLRLQTVFTLLRTFVGGANNHLLRGCLADEAWCGEYDHRVVVFLEELLGATLTPQQQQQIWLPGRDGGLGLHSARLTRSAAYVASWEQCFLDVAKARASTSADALLARVPRTRAALTAAGEDLRQLGYQQYRADWAACFVSSRVKQQKVLMKHVSSESQNKLLQDLDAAGRADLRSAGDKGGAFLLPPTEPSHLMPDEHFRVALRLRLQILHPGALSASPPATACGHRSAQSRQRCNRCLDDRGHHPLTCEVGGGVVRRHDRIRDWLAGWIEAVTTFPVLTEQFVPRWDRVVNGGEEIERARLDVVFHNQNAQRTYIDVSIPSAFSTCPELLRARAARDGAAAARAEDGKRLRYPGPDLVPFVVEALGRPGADAIALLRACAPEQPEERSQALGSAWQALSATLQTQNAELLLAAEAI